MSATAQDVPKRLKSSVTSRNILVVALMLLFSLGLNFACDSYYCVEFGCLTKHSAFRHIQLGSKRIDAEEFLGRAGVYCLGLQGVCNFSDFWREYVVQWDEKGVVVRKQLSYRYHGSGILELPRLFGRRRT